MSFEVFPTKKIIPKNEEIVKCSIQLFTEFLQKENIEQKMEITTKEIAFDNTCNERPMYLVSSDNSYIVLNLNQKGEVYVFYHELTEVDREFWEEELIENKNAQKIKEEINKSLNVGYSWSIKKTMGQPAIVCLYYGFLAIAIAILTDGVIYSDDGAWDYSALPVEGSKFKKLYLDLDEISDISVRDNIKTWLQEINN